MRQGNIARLCVALVLAVALSGCGSFKVKAGPLQTGVGVDGFQAGANIGLEYEGATVAGVDVSVSAATIVQVLTDLWDKL